MRNSDYDLFSFKDYLIKKPKEKFIILRHDVDKKPANALKIANIEKKYGINSTFFFRIKKKVFHPGIISKIEELGYEIGYHYEELADSKGDLKKAINLFKKNLEKIREIADIKTICMHGSTLSRWDNKKLWKYYNFKDFGIIGEGYLSIDFTKIVYISDSGGNWSSGNYIKRDFPCSPTAININIKKTDELINLIAQEKYPNLYILSHPDRWNEGMAWYTEYISKHIRNLIKTKINKIIKDN